mmetsp:Transcript_32946/g.84391  ORF Transcript_32946/g.84391 Transcript_32946/m.84391 type:complete len:243 (+) Transcript_32946:1264-1992(+)
MAVAVLRGGTLAGAPPHTSAWARGPSRAPPDVLSSCPGAVGPPLALDALVVRTPRRLLLVSRHAEALGNVLGPPVARRTLWASPLLGPPRAVVPPLAALALADTGPVVARATLVAVLPVPAPQLDAPRTVRAAKLARIGHPPVAPAAVLGPEAPRAKVPWRAEVAGTPDVAPEVVETAEVNLWHGSRSNQAEAGPCQLCVRWCHPERSLGPVDLHVPPPPAVALPLLVHDAEVLPAPQRVGA